MGIIKKYCRHALLAGVTLMSGLAFAKTGPEIQFLDRYDQLSAVVGQEGHWFVREAGKGMHGDPTVQKGWAIYTWDAGISGWRKICEEESLDNSVSEALLRDYVKTTVFEAALASLDDKFITTSRYNIEIPAIRSAVETNMRNIGRMATDVEAAKTAADAADRKSDAAVVQVDELRELINSLEIDTIKRLIDNATNRVAQVELKTDQLSNTVSTVASLVYGLDDRIIALESEIDNQNRIIAVTTNSVLTLTAALNELRTDIESSISSLEADMIRRDATTLTNAMEYAQNYTDAAILDVNATIASGDSNTLASATSYTDTAILDVNATIASGDSNTLASATSYADSLATDLNGKIETVQTNVDNEAIARAAADAGLDEKKRNYNDLSIGDTFVPDLPNFGIDYWDTFLGEHTILNWSDSDHAWTNGNAKFVGVYNKETEVCSFSYYFDGAVIISWEGFSFDKEFPSYGRLSGTAHFQNSGRLATLKDIEDTGVFSKNITPTVTVGNFPIGEEIPLKDKTFEWFVTEMLDKDKIPAIVAPAVASFTLSNAGAVEAGTSIAPAYTITASLGTYEYGIYGGERALGPSGASWSQLILTDNYGTSTTRTSLTGTLGNITVDDATNYKLTELTAKYSDGGIPQTYKKEKYEDGQIKANMIIVTKSTSAITGYRKWFMYAGDIPAVIDSAFIRNHTSNLGNAKTATGTAGFTVPAGTKCVIIAYPSMYNKRPAKVIDVEGMGLNIIDNFTRQTVSVAGASDKVAAIAYDVYVFNKPEGLAATKLDVTLETKPAPKLAAAPSKALGAGTSKYSNASSLINLLNRQSANPLDVSAVFYSENDLTWYVTKGRIAEDVDPYWTSKVPYPYAGQVLALVEDEGDPKLFYLRKNELNEYDPIEINNTNIEPTYTNGVYIAIIDGTKKLYMPIDEVLSTNSVMPVANKVLAKRIEDMQKEIDTLYTLIDTSDMKITVENLDSLEETTVEDIRLEPGTETK